MKVLDRGHSYALEHLDAEIPTVEILRFVKRIGDKYPGNHPPGYSGTTTQEVIRALIERTEYVNGQRAHGANQTVLRCLREALIALEMRAADERHDYYAVFQIKEMQHPEREPICAGCGHLLCTRTHEL